MIRLKKTVVLLITGLILWGCSSIESPSNRDWISTPIFHEVENQLLNVKFEPQKGEFPYYAFFRLTIANKSASDLIIDWNATRYLFNASDQGVFVFSGIDPEAVRTGSVPTETVPPRSVYTRDIMPMQLIAWSPIKEKTANDRRISPGILPAGENGIHLTVHHGEGVMAIPMSVQLSQTTRP